METYKVDTANSGKTKYEVYVDPELGKRFLSVETLYGVPKAVKGYGKEKVQTTNTFVTMKIVVV